MSEPVIRPASRADLKALVGLENLCFSTDRLSRRSIQHWIKASNALFEVIDSGQGLLGYALVILHKGTRLARLYSIAIHPQAQGQGLARRLLEHIETATADLGRLFMRLEVASHNSAAIALYEKLGYRAFGEYQDYYDDHSDAIRMQKRIRYLASQQIFHPMPWYQQTTDFTCGSASLLMAMASQDDRIRMDQQAELDIWRQATTIFMTSGHGGSHPLGLALAALDYGFDTEVIISTDKPLFIEGVRSEQKKLVMSQVDRSFREKALQRGIKLSICDLSQQQIQQWLNQGYAVIILISTYRLDGRKVPHWVAITAMDDVCLYVHDPSPDEEHQKPLDCQHIPIAREDFNKMSTFGSERLRTAVAIRLHKPRKRKSPR